MNDIQAGEMLEHPNIQSEINRNRVVKSEQWTKV